MATKGRHSGRAEYIKRMREERIAKYGKTGKPAIPTRESAMGISGKHAADVAARKAGGLKRVY